MLTVLTPDEQRAVFNGLLHITIMRCNYRPNLWIGFATSKHGDSVGLEYIWNRTRAGAIAEANRQFPSLGLTYMHGHHSVIVRSVHPEAAAHHARIVSARKANAA